MQQDRGIIIEEGRGAVWAAFRHIPIPGRSPTGYFSGQKKPKRERRRGNNAVGGRDEKAERKLRREMGHDELHATATRPAGYSRPCLDDDQRLSGLVHRCIAELIPLEQNWVHFRYRPESHPHEESGKKFLREYFRQYSQVYLQGCKPSTRALIREMIAWRMNQEYFPRMSAVPFVSQNKTIDRKCWHKTYKEHWVRLCDDLARIDGSALYKVGVKLSFQDC